MFSIGDIVIDVRCKKTDFAKNHQTRFRGYKDIGQNAQRPYEGAYS